MREIKFKIWEEREKKMWDSFNLNEYMSLCESAQDEIQPAGANNRLLLQYTGLKDKNGKEIYEGDIVQVYHLPSNNPEHPEWDNIKCFKFTADMWMGNCYNYTMTESTREIIGNIYQNSELLKP